MKADAANPRPVAGAAPGLPPPFLGGGGMMPACPKSLATVSEGCAPTESQYLSKAREGRAGGSVASEGRGRHGTLRSRRGGTGRKLTSRGRSSARGACFRRSLSGGGWRARQSMRARGVNAMDGLGAARRAVRVGGWTHPAWDRSAPRFRGASRPSALSSPPRISDRTDGSCARSGRVESAPACRPEHRKSAVVRPRARVTRRTNPLLGFVVNGRFARGNNRRLQLTLTRLTPPN